MRVFLEKTLHKNESKIVCCVWNELNKLYPEGHSRHFTYADVKNILFAIEKYGINHDDIGWYTKKRRWVGPGRILPWFIPQFWLRPAAYLHDILYIITKILRKIRSGELAISKTMLDEYNLEPILGRVNKEISDIIFYGAARAFKPWFIPWKSVVSKFYLFILEKCGEMGLED